MDFEQIREKLDGRASGLIEIRKHSCVLIPFVEREGRLCLLFELRSAGISQPGEVCFPGGRMEAGETPLQTAVREIGEELSVPEGRILYAHEYDTLIHYANMAIHTVVAQLDPQVLEEIRPAENEVAEWFTIPVDWLAENEPVLYEYRILPEIRDDFPYDIIESPDKYNWRTGKWTIPIWNYEGHCLWGMTARIVYALLKSLA